MQCQCGGHYQPVCDKCESTGWISTKDRLPTKEECAKFFGWFLVFRQGHHRTELDRYDGHDIDRQWESGWKYGWHMPITHWMPLPKNPKQDD
jgi:hypothetical protein